MDAKRITALVPCLARGVYTPQELNSFIDFSKKVSLSYLKYQMICGKAFVEEADLHQIEDLALDCIADMFARNEHGEFFRIKTALSQYSEPLDDHIKMLKFLRGIIIKKTIQDLSRIFRDRSPDSAKIIRNIRVCIHPLKLFSGFRLNRREYIYSKGMRESGLRKNKPPMPEELLRRSYLDVYKIKDEFPQIISKMLCIVEAGERYQNYLAIYTILHIVRDLRIKSVEHHFSGMRTLTPADEFLLKQMDQARDRALRGIEKKINDHYLRNRLLSGEQASIYLRALNDLLDDMTHSEKTKSHFKQLRFYIPQLTTERYRKEHRTIFEYLARWAVKFYRQELKNLMELT